ncbi:MAG: hypothetical protein QM479_10665 [Pseudomonadota bacterium]
MKIKLTNTYIKNIDPLICDLKHYDTELEIFYFRIKLNGKVADGLDVQEKPIKDTAQQKIDKKRAYSGCSK